MLDEFRRLALFTSGVAELTRHRAEQLVRDMVSSGDVRKDQASSLVKTVLDIGKENRHQLGELIRTEIRNQVGNLGLATQRDVERLERRVARLEECLKAERVAAKAAAKSTSRNTKKTTAKSTKKTTVRKKTTGDGESRV